jgi:predicted Rdx family selenoprotein
MADWYQFAQELLSTFGNALGEVALVPSQGGVFIVDIWCQSPEVDSEVTKRTIWNRKLDGGFPGTSRVFSAPEAASTGSK